MGELHDYQTKFRVRWGVSGSVFQDPSVDQISRSFGDFPEANASKNQLGRRPAPVQVRLGFAGLRYLTTTKRFLRVFVDVPSKSVKE